MSIKVVTDSTCDLPDDLVEKHSITVVPLYINFIDGSYLDGVEISRQQFYERLPHYPEPPKTAAPGSEVFASIYRQLAAEGAAEILSIHISPALSGTIDIARVAAQEVSEVPVTVLDSKQLSMGVGFAVLTAAQAAAENKSMEQILALLEKQIPHTYVFAALDTLEYLRRSGRVNGLVSGLGNLLNIKPLLKMHNGVAESEKIRTEGKAWQRVIDLVSEVGPIQQLVLVHTNAAEKAQLLWEQAKHLFPHLPHPISVDVTPVIGAHIGPKAVGFACVAADS